MEQQKTVTTEIPGYYLDTRENMLPFIPSTVKKVYEAGCGAGKFGALVKQKYDCEYWGIEPHPQAADAARQVLDKVSCGFFDENTDLEGHTFDCFVFNDVLEHMTDPWTVLEFCGKHLNPGGVIVSSLPNFLYISNITRLLMTQDWKYQDCGILDKTHFRFFTKKSMIRMFKETGFEVVRMEGLNPKTKYTFTLANALLLNRLDAMRYLQYAVVARVVKT